MAAFRAASTIMRGNRAGGGKTRTKHVARMVALGSKRYLSIQRLGGPFFVARPVGDKNPESSVTAMSRHVYRHDTSGYCAHTMHEGKVPTCVH
jgi:hypothetical protein